jgi:hypothetical protein
MKSVLFGISPVHPLTYTAVPLVLVAATVLASYLLLAERRRGSG